MNTKIFKNLNQHQHDAVSHIKGPSLILAGAGSGKTRVLVHKVQNLIENDISPYSIVMITFTNKAASEMKNRIQAFNPTGESLGYIGTFHAFCAKLLRINGALLGFSNKFVIYDDGDQLALIRKIIKEKGSSKFSPSYFLYRISLAQKELRKSDALDFDDLLVKVVELFTFHPEILEKYQNRHRYILVDEFQDTNLAQYAITRLLADKYKNITIVGDFSQSIYSFRGADITNLEKFQKDFEKAKVFNLERNYRSSQTILDFAYKIISKNKSHPILHLMSENIQGEEIVFFESDNEQEEAVYITQEIEKMKDEYPYSSFAVLYRTNAQSRIIEEAFLHVGTPYVLVGGTRFYERKEIKDILAYLKLLVNPKDSVARDRAVKIGKKRFEGFAKLYNEIKESYEDFSTEILMEKVFESTNYLDLYSVIDPEDAMRIENIKELKSVAISFPNVVEFLEQVALVESEYFEKEKRGPKDGVKLMTLHQAKGLEFDVVFIVGVEEGILPHSRSIDDYFQLEEERRLFYVGITRARKRLYITYTKRRTIFGRRGEALKSRFLFESEDYVS